MRLAFEEIRYYGRDSLQVSGRIRSALAQASLLGAHLHHQEQQDLKR